MGNSLRPTSARKWRNTRKSSTTPRSRSSERGRVMRVMVLGAGVIGTTSAYYLTKSGHEVEVVDRRSGPALATSFANAGGICPGFAGPWAAPGMPRKIARWLFACHAPVALRPQLDPHQWWWVTRFLRNCSPERFARNKARMQRIAHYSKACITELRAETGIAF